jgi:glucosyl-dolichyl phosphate glucuronosyltransferase
MLSSADRVRTPRAPGELTVAVVICTSTRDRLPLLRRCVESLVAGERAPDELFVVVNGRESLMAELAGSLPSAARLLHTHREGLSAARNVGVVAATSDVVAFVDDDARVDRTWLPSFAVMFSLDEHIVGAGGPVIPDWGGDRRWMCDELLWVVGCTYSGHRQDAGAIRNPIGCNMAFRRDALLKAGSFSTSFGKRGNALQTCDETELGLRLERSHGRGAIVYVPGARVHHHVPPARVSWRLLVRRSISEGLAKGRLRRLYAQRPLGPERAYTRLLLTESVPHLLRESVRGRRPEPAQGALAICGSLIIAGGAFAIGFARETRLHRRRLRSGEAT